MIPHRPLALLLAMTVAMAACRGGDDAAANRDGAGDGTPTTSGWTTALDGVGRTAAGSDIGTDPGTGTGAGGPTEDSTTAAETMTLDGYKSEIAMIAARGLDEEAGRRIEVAEMEAALVRACQLAADGYAAATDPMVTAAQIMEGIATDPTTADVVEITTRAIDVYFEIGGCAVDPAYLEPIRLAVASR